VAECAHLAGEDLFEVVVVCNRSDRGGVGGERDARESWSFGFEAIQKFRGEVLGICGGPAVAAREDFAVAAQAADHAFDRGPDGALQFVQGGELEVRAVAKIGRNAFSEIHAATRLSDVGARIVV
jgi:hypothetical protein